MSINIKPQGEQASPVTHIVKKTAPEVDAFKNLFVDEFTNSSQPPVTTPIKSRSLQFSVNNDTGDVMIKVLDKETEEVIRTIPQEEIEQFISTEKSKSGGFINTKV